MSTINLEEMSDPDFKLLLAQVIDEKYRRDQVAFIRSCDKPADISDDHARFMDTITDTPIIKSFMLPILPEGTQRVTPKVDAKQSCYNCRHLDRHLPALTTDDAGYCPKQMDIMHKQEAIDASDCTAFEAMSLIDQRATQMEVLCPNCGKISCYRDYCSRCGRQINRDDAGSVIWPVT